MDDKRPLILIDGNSLVNRMFYALPPLSNAEGEPVHAVYGFARVLIKAIGDYNPGYIAVAFDLPEPTFRHKMYDGYKVKRKGMPGELASQMPILKRMLGEMGIAMAEKSGFEADDIIGTLAKRYPVATFIVTGDRDSLQLIDKNTTVLLTKRGITEVDTLTPETLKEKYGLSPSQVVDFKAIAGDASDCIPGVAGIGEKGAHSLIDEFGSLDGVYAHLDSVAPRYKQKLEDGKESAYLSQRLAQIDTNMELELSLDDMRYDFPFGGKVRAFFEKMDFSSLVKRADLFSDAAAIVEAEKKQTVVVETEDIYETERIYDVLKSADTDVAAVLFGDEVSFALSETKTYNIKIKKDLFDQGLMYDDAVRSLSPLLADEKTVKAVFDAKEVQKTVKKYGFAAQNLFDTRLAHYLADSPNVCEKARQLFERYELDIGAAQLITIKGILERELEKEGMNELFYDIEQPLTSVLFDMEETGFTVNPMRLTELGKGFLQQAEMLSAEIYRLCGQQFNINSPKQLAVVLFEDMKIPYPKKGGSYSTSAEILEQVAHHSPVIPLILQYRTVTKLNSTYVEGLKKLVKPDGTVHTEFKQMSTATGRLSSAEPNLQNIPVREDDGRELRGAFTAREGKTLIAADYSQIELRLLAHFSADPKLISAYEKGEDIHASTAAEVFGVPMSDVTPKMRREAKVVNFGIIYGISDYGLARNLGVPVKTASDYKKMYFSRFPDVKQYLDDCIVSAKKLGYSETLLGRRRRIPELTSSNYNMRSFGERVAMNMPLQGSAADIIKIAMLRVFEELKGSKSKLILQVHDELIIEADDAEIDSVKAMLIRCMESAVSLKVPLEVSVGAGKNWLECK